MTDFERSLALGTAVLYFLWLLKYQRGPDGHTFGVCLSERAREAGTRYGYGNKEKQPHMSAMLVITGGDGIFRYDSTTATPAITATRKRRKSETKCCST